LPTKILQIFSKTHLASPPKTKPINWKIKIWEFHNISTNPTIPIQICQKKILQRIQQSNCKHKDTPSYWQPKNREKNSNRNIKISQNQPNKLYYKKIQKSCPKPIRSSPQITPKICLPENPKEPIKFPITIQLSQRFFYPKIRYPSTGNQNLRSHLPKKKKQEEEKENEEETKRKREKR
jgi:hypothetical protein